MRTLELALPPSPPSLVPSFNYNSTARSVRNDVKTNFDVQLFLRKPKHQKSEPVVVIQQPKIQPQKPTPCCSTSDILRLMDSLSLPGNEDLYSCLAKELTRENDGPGAYELQVHIMNLGISYLVVSVKSEETWKKKSVGRGSGMRRSIKCVAEKSREVYVI